MGKLIKSFGKIDLLKQLAVLDAETCCMLVSLALRGCISMKWTWPHHRRENDQTIKQEYTNYTHNKPPTFGESTANSESICEKIVTSDSTWAMMQEACHFVLSITCFNFRWTDFITFVSYPQCRPHTKFFWHTSREVAIVRYCTHVSHDAMRSGRLRKTRLTKAPAISERWRREMAFPPGYRQCSSEMLMRPPPVRNGTNAWSWTTDTPPYLWCVIARLLVPINSAYIYHRAHPYPAFSPLFRFTLQTCPIRGFIPEGVR
jgi:hypothetical protein